MSEAKAMPNASGRVERISARRTKTGTWHYIPYEGPGDPVWAVMVEDLVVALVKDERDAETICRSRGELNRITVESRRYMVRLRALNEQNRMLMATLRRITDILQKSVSPMEITNAKAEVTRVVKNLIQRGRG